MNDFYVYVYIDPRNYDEFYYGKGCGDRRLAHLSDTSDSEKAKRIKDIKRAGLEPIIKVVAKGLSEHDALLVEKALLWRLGKHLTNISTGHYAKNFRPQDTFHLDLPEFDYQNGLYFYNVGEGIHRSWDDYRKYGIISAGQAPRFRQAMLSFSVGDVIAAYLPKHGFVGVGKILTKAKPIREVTIEGVPLVSMPLIANMTDNSEDDQKSEYVALVEWYATVDKSDARFKKKSGLYTPQKVKASLDNQPLTAKFLAEAFELNLNTILNQSNKRLAL